MNQAELRNQLASLGADALKVYRDALAGGNVGIAKYRIAADVLRALGVIGDNVTAATGSNEIEVSFVTLTNDTDGNITIDRTAESSPDTQPRPTESGDVS